MIFTKKFYLLIIIALSTGNAFTQKNSSRSDAYAIVIASKDYQKSKLHQLLFGKNRRKEWLTPVCVPILILDTAFGGLTPYEKAGGGESKSLRLKSAAGKEYVLRSIEKSRQDAVPKLLTKA